MLLNLCGLNKEPLIRFACRYRLEMLKLKLNVKGFFLTGEEISPGV